MIKESKILFIKIIIINNIINHLLIKWLFNRKIIKSKNKLTITIIIILTIIPITTTTIKHIYHHLNTTTNN
jgi:hypothetical protein